VKNINAAKPLEGPVKVGSNGQKTLPGKKQNTKSRKKHKTEPLPINLAADIGLFNVADNKLREKINAISHWSRQIDKLICNIQLIADTVEHIDSNATALNACIDELTTAAELPITSDTTDNDTEQPNQTQQSQEIENQQIEEIIQPQAPDDKDWQNIAEQIELLTEDVRAAINSLDTTGKTILLGKDRLQTELLNGKACLMLIGQNLTPDNNIPNMLREQNSRDQAIQRLRKYCSTINSYTHYINQFRESITEHAESIVAQMEKIWHSNYKINTTNSNSAHSDTLALTFKMLYKKKEALNAHHDTNRNIILKLLN
jgi:prefoldin subunit 5